MLCSCLVTATAAEAQTSAARPPAARTPAPPAAPTPGGSIAACDSITPAEAKGLLGPDAMASTAPSKGSFTSCGYTSPAGDALTISVADYGLPSVARQFFDKTRELLKTTTSEETVGAPAFSYTTAGAPATASAPAPASPAPVFNVTTLIALKDQRTVKLDATGPVASLPAQLPKLRAILTRVLGTLPAAPAPDPPR